MVDKDYPVAETLDELQDDLLYRVDTLGAVLKSLGLSFSIYSIRDYETWKCLNYKCGKRHLTEVVKCVNCKGSVSTPLIQSPRTRGGGSGPGHRRYMAKEIRDIVEVFQSRE